MLAGLASLDVSLAEGRLTQVPEGPAGSSGTEALLSATWLGRVGDSADATVAVSWKGDSSARVEIFEDRDANGRLGEGERILVDRVVDGGMQVLSVGESGDGLGLRWATSDAEGSLKLRHPPKDGQSCGWQPGFSVQDLDGPLNAMVVWDDGLGPALYVGGGFTYVGGVGMTRIQRFRGHRVPGRTTQSARLRSTTTEVGRGRPCTLAGSSPAPAG